MPLRQTNALSENPDGLPMRIAGRYNRVVKASIARAWENVRDWEHLPWLHADSFSDCRLEEEGNWGWRAVTKGVGPAADQETVIELAIDADASRYVSRTLAGGLPGVEIWTRLTKLAAHQTQVDVEFHLPHLTEAGPVRLISLNGEIRAYPARCPHLKGPLQFAVPDAQGCITCPWHGYRFNVATGLSADGRGLSLGVVPQIRIDENQQAFLIWPQ